MSSGGHQNVTTLLNKKNTSLHDDKRVDDSSSDEEPRKNYCSDAMSIRSFHLFTKLSWI